MFEFSVVFRATQSIKNTIERPLIENQPKMCNFTFSNYFKQVDIKPKLFFSEEVPNIKKVIYAPSVVLICFTCDSKTEYFNKKKEELRKILSQIKKKYVQIVPLLINDLSKDKSFFNMVTSLISTIQTDFPLAQFLQVEKNGTITTNEINKIWNVIIEGTQFAFEKRINMLNQLLEKPLSVSSILYYLRLSIIYTNTTFFELQEIATQKALVTLDMHPNLFSTFIQEKDMETKIDVFRKKSITIASELDTEFEIRKCFIEQQIYCYLRNKRHEIASEIGYNFYQFISKI